MSARSAFLVLLVLASVGCASQREHEPGPSPEAAGVERLAWLSGSWRGERDGSVIEEHWSTPAGGTMVGFGRVVAKERTLFFEYLRLEERGEEVLYLASPRGAPATPFKLVSAEAKSAVFENPEHDFPTRISYRLEGDGSLVARTEGRPEQAALAEEFRYRRAK